MASLARTCALALVLIAACYVPTIQASWGCAGWPFYQDCEGWICDGKSCLGQCKYGGQATAICNQGYWNLTVTCNKAPEPKKCTFLPPSCEGITWTSDCIAKDKVWAYCGTGYTGAVSATCVNGVWQLYGSCKKIEAPKPPPAPKCSAMPPSMTGASWQCGGDKCWGFCGNGYTGVVTAYCFCGKWYTYGMCKKIEYVPPRPKACYGAPPSCLNADWKCVDDKCYGFCDSGYTGSINAYCWDGKWVVSGSCTKVIMAPPPVKTCKGMPPNCTGISWSPRCDGKSYCGANCMAGYHEAYVYSHCDNGVWSKPVGECKPVVTVHKKCHGKPKKGRYAFSWKCHHGKKCTAKCAWGCRGGMKAECKDGKWKVHGSCKVHSWWRYKRHHW